MALALRYFLFYVLSSWNLFFKCIPSCPRDIYRPNFLASLAFMISLYVLGLYKWLLYTSQDDSLFITRRITSFNMVLSWGICFLLPVKYQWHRRWHECIEDSEMSSSRLFKSLKIGLWYKRQVDRFTINLAHLFFYSPLTHNLNYRCGKGIEIVQDTEECWMFLILSPIGICHLF